MGSTIARRGPQRDGCLVSWGRFNADREAKALCVVELFNHQTQHRGQVHAMLTAAGAEPEPTDLSMLA
ncbi:DinB family protein [Mesorhizobium sp. M6A.T.Ce.TU.002.03.1.1]|uniref:DinB family protein n=1 Tax=Mesorhizobium sp. M6A.T.Ce.TU.002.03.1.1 TaxID=2496782 RepID=UPI00247A47FE|nr:DinB family protein [Mesorhizobium sp. M6A.T.Ce.TU.002.03.1.1]